MNASIERVLVAGSPQGPVSVVLLSVEREAEVLPIFIGAEEAAAIARGLEAHDIGRPLTHDLLLDVIEELGGRVEHVAVSDLRDDTYIADLHIATPRGEAVVDARPSDSLALAARTNADIEVDEMVFEDGRRPPDEFEGFQDIREVAEFGTSGAGDVYE